MSATVTLDSTALATAANNALAFLPANSQVKVARVTVSADGVEFMATDTYAAGRDSCPVASFRGEPQRVLISREALQALDKAGRSDRKGFGALSVIAGEGLAFTPQDQAVEPVSVSDLRMGNGQALEMFEAIEEMLEPEQEFRTAFQPQLLMRFSKVKADKADRVADLAIDDPDAPVLVKIGTTFKGLIMPVHRDVHAEMIGQDGLW